MSMVDEVTKALQTASGEPWERELALTLAHGLDESPSNASASRELRSLMASLTGTKRAVEVDDVDELAKRRAARRARASGS